MVDEVYGKWEGLEELRARLLALPDKLRKRALLNSLRAGARVFQREAKRLAPVLRQPKKYRKPGTVRDAIRVRTSKLARRQGDVGVFVNVKPAPRAQRGAKNPNDPFYWRFPEFGTRTKKGAVRVTAVRYLQRAASSKPGQALAEIKRTLGPQIKKLEDQR